ncbi:MAG: hypothetical protein KAI47_11185 [Deltaproteobacteria bacterium]|nr:hypothetical protein [Deltaproteobacteria bacterium]
MRHLNAFLALLGSAIFFIVLGAACDTSTTPPVDLGVDRGVADSLRDQTAHRESAPPEGGSDAVHDAPPPACPPNTSTCVDEATQRACKKQPNGTWAWIKEACVTGELCLGTACSATCADECDLDTTRQVGGKSETCGLFSVATKSFIPLSKEGLHDRARRHNAWIRAHHLPGGTINDLQFKTAALKVPARYNGLGDSAIWTGTYLAAEALRLKVTGSKDALASVEHLVDTIHRLFAVNGHPGYLSRYTASLSNPDPLIVSQYHPGDERNRHHETTYQGQKWFWFGDTSRDQYQGVMLGYAWAYEALPPGKHRDLIRDDMVAICDELMKVRKGMTVLVRINIGGTWIELPVPMDVTNVILNPTEFRNGHPYAQIGSDSDPTNVEDGSQMSGFREYWPDYHDIIQQIPLLGPLLNVPMPRSGSAIMLAAIMRIGILVTEGVPAAAAENAKIKTYYAKHIGSWLSKMKAYVNFNDASACWRKYYGSNIVWEPMWNLARLETDPALRRQIVDGVMDAKLWPLVKDHKNVFFAFIYGSQQVSGPTVTTVIDAAKSQLAQFQEAPKIRRAVDNMGKYPADPHCPGQTSVATDVKDRAASDFIWQRNPFKLVDSGAPQLVYPGIDYVLPYWMARYYGWTKDDSEGSCLRWK